MFFRKGALRMRKVSMMIFLALCMLAVGAYSQNIAGSTAGYVADQQRSSAPHAAVRVVPPNKIIVSAKTSRADNQRLETWRWRSGT